MFLRKFSPVHIALVVSIVVISSAVWYTRSSRAPEQTEIPVEDEASKTNEELQAVRGVQTDDHVLGNPNAPIKFYVYSDFSCSYCKEYHATMRTLMRLYGEDGKVAWIFRQMPFVQIHPESPMYALASECVAKEKGDAGFWAFADALFERIDPVTPLKAADIVVLAEQAGVSKQAFVACMRTNDMQAVEEDFMEAVNLGVNGTPFTIIETPGRRSSHQGAQSLKTLASSLQSAVRALSVEELESPLEANSFEADSFVDEFNTIDVGTTTVSTTTTPLTSGTSAVPPQNPPSASTPEQTPPQNPPATQL
jgi:protein-disulfide isomerase